MATAKQVTLSIDSDSLASEEFYHDFHVYFQTPDLGKTIVTMQEDMIGHPETIALMMQKTFMPFHRPYIPEDYIGPQVRLGERPIVEHSYIDAEEGLYVFILDISYQQHGVFNTVKEAMGLALRSLP